MEPNASFHGKPWQIEHFGARADAAGMLAKACHKASRTHQFHHLVAGFTVWIREQVWHHIEFVFEALVGADQFILNGCCIQIGHVWMILGLAADGDTFAGERAQLVPAHIT